MHSKEMSGMDQVLVEKRENVPTVLVKMMSTDELEHFIEQSNATTKDRFRSPDEGGVFTYFFPDLVFDSRLRDRSQHLIIEENGVIVGIGKLTKKQKQEDVYEMASVSVDPSYEGRGYARKILEEMFQIAKDHKWILISSEYSAEGNKKLKKIVLELAKKFGVEFYDDLEWAKRSWSDV